MLKKSATLLFTILLATVALLPTAALFAESSATFKVGALLCQTSVCAETGQASLNGLKLAAAEINATGGILGKKVELVPEDSRDAESPLLGVSAFKKLTANDAIKYIIGPTWSNAGLPLVPLVQRQSDLIVTSPSLGVAEFNEGSDRIFNLWPHDSVSTEALAEFAIKKGLKTAATLNIEDPWSSAQSATFKQHFETLGGKVNLQINPPRDSVDLKIEVLKLISLKPEAVLLVDWAPAVVLARQLENLGYKGQLLFIQIDNERIKQGGKALDGTVYAAYAPPASDFTAKYQAEYKTSPALSADVAYDTLYLYKRAIEAAKSFDASLVKVELQKQKFLGASGEIVFDAQGGVMKTPLLYEIRDSQSHLLETK